MLSPKQALPLLAGAAVALSAVPAATAAAGAGTGARAAAQKSRHARARRGAGKVLSGRGTPSPRLGRIGDVYLRTSDRTLWGPKTRRGWGRPRPLAGRGDSGRDGAAGRPGATGPTGAPSAPAAGVPYVAARAPQPSVIDTSRHEDGSIWADRTVTLEVQIPAGVSFVTLRPRGGPAPGAPTTNGCTLRSWSLDLTGRADDGASLATVLSYAGERATLYCELTAAAGAGASTDVGGTEVVVTPVITSPGTAPVAVLN